MQMEGITISLKSYLRETSVHGFRYIAETRPCLKNYYGPWSLAYHLAIPPT